MLLEIRNLIFSFHLQLIIFCVNLVLKLNHLSACHIIVLVKLWNNSNECFKISSWKVYLFLAYEWYINRIVEVLARVKTSCCPIHSIFIDKLASQLFILNDDLIVFAEWFVTSLLHMGASVEVWALVDEQTLVVKTVFEVVWNWYYICCLDLTLVKVQNNKVETIRLRISCY